MSEYVNGDGSISQGTVPEMGGKALSSSNPMPASPAQGVVADRSTTTIAVVSTVLIAANANRRKWFVAAPQTADIWIAFGSAASVGGGGSYRIPAGGSASSSAGVIETNAINYFCATAGLQIAAYEV